MEDTTRVHHDTEGALFRHLMHGHSPTVTVLSDTEEQICSTTAMFNDIEPGEPPMVSIDVGSATQRLCALMSKVQCSCGSEWIIYLEEPKYVSPGNIVTLEFDVIIE